MPKKSDHLQPLYDSLYNAIMEVASTSKVVTEDELRRIFHNKNDFKKDGFTVRHSSTQLVSEEICPSSSMISRELVSSEESSHLSTILESESDGVKEQCEKKEIKSQSDQQFGGTTPVNEEQLSTEIDLMQLVNTESENLERVDPKWITIEPASTQSFNTTSEISQSSESQTQLNEDVDVSLEVRPYTCPTCFNTSVRYGEDLSIYSDQIHNTYCRRLQEIREHGKNDIDLRLKTYEEWVSTLTKLNKSMEENTLEFEKEFLDHLEKAELKAETNNPPVAKCTQYRNDLEKLVQVVRNAYHNDIWSLNGIYFETMCRSNILRGLTRNSNECSSSD